uniref:Uncharacterized protein n=1 Tax=Human herpesvirus 2 TaxID=10310 RepID=A0A481TMV4_HHV2|nr:hypothetical protein [Human alphaherpesvirus 2]QBH82944.1 hypothetical protein [Human alphaherpesvirus 2]QBH85316.1 hypothetical protein [Human alphaherpesvirus 2]
MPRNDAPGDSRRAAARRSQRSRGARHCRCRSTSALFM